MSNCSASILPEDSTPPEHIHCSDCGLDKHGTRMVWGEGNPDASIIVLLDNPGAREDRKIILLYVVQGKHYRRPQTT